MRVLTEQALGCLVRDGTGVGEFGSGLGIVSGEAVDVDEHQGQDVIPARADGRQIRSPVVTRAVAALVGDRGEVGEPVGEAPAPDVSPPSRA